MKEQNELAEILNEIGMSTDVLGVRVFDIETLAEFIKEATTTRAIEELEKLKEFMTLYPVDPDWHYAAPEKQIDLALEELRRSLKNG